MPAIKESTIPDSGLLNSYTLNGSYTDCYVTEIATTVTHSQYVAAFYTSWIFKLERFILRWVVNKPSTDAQAKQLADGSNEAFSAWSVESRSDNQLLMADFQGRTRSWLMVMPLDTANTAQTRLYFGSAVVPIEDPETGETSMGGGFNLLLGFHKLYSRILLRSARSRLESQLLR